MKTGETIASTLKNPPINYRAGSDFQPCVFVST